MRVSRSQTRVLHDPADRPHDGAHDAGQRQRQDQPGTPATVPPMKTISTTGSGCIWMLRPTVSGMKKKLSSSLAKAKTPTVAYDDPGIGGKLGGGDQHDQDAADHRPDHRNPCEHRRDQRQDRRGRHADKPQADGEDDGVDHGELEQPLKVVARGRIDAVEHVDRALEKSIGHAARERIANTRPSRSRKNAKNGASSSDGSHAAALSKVSPIFFCT